MVQNAAEGKKDVGSVNAEQNMEYRTIQNSGLSVTITNW